MQSENLDLLAQTRRHLAFLDRALLNLMEERSRLLSALDQTLDTNLDDLLMRATGDFAPEALGAVFEAISAGCHGQRRSAR